MLERINHPAARRVEKWLWEHPKTTIFFALCSLAFIFLPQWGNAVWYWFSADPPLPTIAKKMNWQWTLPTLHFSASWVTGPIGLALLGTIIYLLFRGSRLSDGSVAPDFRKDNSQGIVCLKTYVSPTVFKNGTTPTDKILLRCVREPIPPVAHIVDWEDEVEAYLKENIGKFQAIEFSKSAPITVYPNQACNRDLTNKLYTQIERIGQIISELRPS